MKKLVIALSAVGAVLLLTCAGGAWWVYQSEPFQDMLTLTDVVAAAGDFPEDQLAAESAPGTAALRDLGCELASVKEGRREFERAQKMLDAMDPFFDDEERSEARAALRTERWKAAVDPRVVSCRLPEGAPTLTCRRVEQTYRRATGYAGWVQSHVVDAGYQGCNGYYDPDGDEIPYETLASL